MDNKKFEQLIQLITNENEEQARALFHDIVVEKSREIYESMMDEEMGGGLGGQVGDFQDEIASEEQGMTEEDDDGFGDLGADDGDEEEISLDGDEDDFGGEEGDFGAEGGEEGLEDRVVSLEDKLDELMAEFEELMADEEGEEEHNDGENDPDFGDEEGDGSIEGADDEEFGAPDEEGAMMEAVQLKQVGGSTYNKFGTMGDNGVQTKSPALTKPKVVSTGAKPVNVTGSAESVPSAPKAPSNAYTKGETQVKGAGNFKNSPGQNAGKTSFKEKVSGGFGTKTPQGKEVGAGGSVPQNDKSIVGESRRTRK
jgi:hypothetical protein